MYNVAVSDNYGIDTSLGFFDCTNFYFEIDEEDDFRRKGPSKERRLDPIVGMGLLLDANRIPIALKVFPGNESEQPVIREILSELRLRHKVPGRIIRIADKGINSAENICHTKDDGDGYIFSKSIKKLPATEMDWVLLDQDYEDVYDDKGNLQYQYKETVDSFIYSYKDQEGNKIKRTFKEKRIVSYNPKLAKKQRKEIKRQIRKADRLILSKAKRKEFGDLAKYVNFKSSDDEGNTTDNPVNISLNDAKIEKDLRLAGYNMLVTSETNLPAKQIYAAYHELWRIEESFKIMKSDLETRPVYLQKQETITGHFLICYLAVLLLRLFQFHVLEDKFSSSEILNVARNYELAKVSSRRYINLSKNAPLLRHLAQKYKLPVLNCYLDNSDIKIMLDNWF
ncbi:MAG: IS1634 family transposase [Clostridiaceae bacterium]|nr:IS1634 family transposase [Clostridiaceae bacterium]